MNSQSNSEQQQLKKLERHRRLCNTQKQVIVSLEGRLEFYKARCAELELFAAHQRVQQLPKIARDNGKYTGDQVQMILFQNESLKNQVETLAGQLAEATHQDDEALTPDKQYNHLAHQLEPYGVRFS